MARSFLPRFLGALNAALIGLFCANAASNDFVNFETAPVHPIDVSPDGQFLAVCSLSDRRIEFFQIGSDKLTPSFSAPVGLDPVSVRFRSDDEVWVVNFISDSISIINISNQRVIATISTLNEPSDVVFAGVDRAFVSCAQPNAIQLFDTATRMPLQKIALDGERPKAMALSPDRRKLYVAFFESGNGSTILAPRFTGLDHFPPAGPLDLPDGPYAGRNPPPNSGAKFEPAIVPTNAPPRVGLIVKKNADGRWMDDNRSDWTEFVSGTNAFFSGRAPGWDVQDHDLAIVDTADLSIRYISSLMNICAGVAVNPASGEVSVVGTDALNEVRFEPVLNGIFVRVKMALVDPAAGRKKVFDLNPHLDYRTRLLPEVEKARSIGDPRGVVWNGPGTRAYISGMGSSNLVVVDQTGQRLADVTMPAGPAGVAYDERHGRVYVFSRFAAAVTSLDAESLNVLQTIPLFDPTPPEIKEGRNFFYDTHLTSGLGQAACASCHVDARFDRLAWDLGNPTGEMMAANGTNRNFGRFLPAQIPPIHPMKGPMVTQTLQDIISHEPFHWRGDRDGLEAFNGTFTNLQSAPVSLTTNEMKQFKEFLRTVHFPPNPFRPMDNTLSTKVSLPEQFSLGRGESPAGTLLPPGNARAGLARFRLAGIDGCIHCHTLPSGLGSFMQWTGISWKTFAPGPNGENHVALVSVLRAELVPFKIPALRNLQDKIGFTIASASSRTGFGFFHDGHVDSMVRFLQDSFDFRTDQETADMIAFLLQLPGGDLPLGSVSDPDRPPGVTVSDTPAGVGKQISFTGGTSPPEIQIMMSLARTGRVDLIVDGSMLATNRSWLYMKTSNRFQANRRSEVVTLEQLKTFAGPDAPLTFMLVPLGTGNRLALDRDRDGFFDLDEIDRGLNPADPASFPTPHVVVESIVLEAGALEIRWTTDLETNFQLESTEAVDSADWNAVGNSVLAPPGTATSVALIPSDLKQRFYRVRWIQPEATSQ